MRIRHSFALLSASMIAIAAPALAQSPPPERSDSAHEGGHNYINDIIVTARRRDESIQDVPQTINVVTAAQMEKLNLRNFTDIATTVPGLQMQATTAFSNSATVRGIAFDPAASGNNPSVEFYLNDAPISSSFLFQSTFDLGQFELQRGPQGTLRGRAAPSGSIAVTTRRPDLSEVGLMVSGTATSLRARKVEGAFNIPIIADVLAVRIAGVVDENEGNRVRSIWEDDYATVSRPYRDTQAIRASVRFEPTEWVSVNVMYQNLHNLSRSYEQAVSDSLLNAGAAAPTKAIIRPNDRRSIDEQGLSSRMDQDILVGNLDLRFAGQKLSYVGLYSKQDIGVFTAQDFGNFFTPSAGNVGSTNTVSPRPGTDLGGFDPVCQNEVERQSISLTTGGYNQCLHTISKRNAHEVRLASEDRIGGIFDYVIGGFYDHNNNPSNLTQETPILFGPTTVGLINLTSILRRGKSTEKSFFGNVNAHLLDDKLELSGGLRYIDFKNSNALFQSSSAGTVQCGEYTDTVQDCIEPTRDAQDTNATIYMGSVKYRLNADTIVYAQTGSSWRPGPRAVGNFSFGPDLGGQTARELFYTVVPPEKSTAYEVGIKTSFLDGRGTFNLSAFHQKFKGYPFVGPEVFYISTSATGAESVAIANVPGGFGFISPVNVTVNGIEGEASLQLQDRWSIGINASYADGKIKNGTIACTDLNSDGIPDSNPVRPTVDQLQAAVGAGQTMSQCSGINRRAAVTPKFSATFQSEYGFELSDTSDVFLRGIYSFSGATNANPDNPYDNVKAYGLLNLFAGFRDTDGQWEISAFAKNVLNDRRILSATGSALATSYQLGATGMTYTSEYRGINMTAPREFGITARVALGSR